MADDKQTTQSPVQAAPTETRIVVDGKEGEALAKAYLERGEVKPGHFYTLRTRGGVTGVLVEKNG